MSSARVFTHPGRRCWWEKMPEGFLLCPDRWNNWLPQEESRCNHCGFKQVSPLEALRINMNDLRHEIIKHQSVYYWFQTPSSTSSCPLRHSAVGLDPSCDWPCLSVCLVSGALFSSTLRDFASGGHDHLCLEADSLLGANPQQTHWV